MLGQYAAAFRDKQIVNDQLRRQNEQIENQLYALQDKMKEVKAQIRINPKKQVVLKKCDHVPLLNKLEDDLKHKESEFKSSKIELDKGLREKER